jgi:hypothetical protein
MTSDSLCSATILCSTCCSSSLAVLLPSLCCPAPALANTLAPGPDPLNLRDGHHPGAAPAVAPHPSPDIHLEEPAVVVPVQLCVISNQDVDLDIWNPYEVYSRYIPCIFHVHVGQSTYTWNILCICQVNEKSILMYFSEFQCSKPMPWLRAIFYFWHLKGSY